MAGVLLIVWFGAASAGTAAATEADLKSIVILDFELIDEQAVAAPDQVVHPQLETVSRQLREEIAAAGLYRVLDLAPAADLIQTIKAREEFRTCNGCEVDVAKLLGSDRVMLTWIQKVSNLIINLNIQIEDGKTGEILLNKSADIRGPDPRAFNRGIKYIVQSMVDKNQGNR